MLNFLSEFIPVDSPEVAGIFEDYYVLSYHIPGDPYLFKYFNSRDQLLCFLSGISDSADFVAVEHNLRRSLNIKELLKEVEE